MDGEDTVRTRLATSVYGDFGPKKGLAEEWLAYKERERSSISNLAMAEAASRAASAAERAAVATEAQAVAATEQARIARHALTTAIAAAIISAIALGVGIYTLFR